MIVQPVAYADIVGLGSQEKIYMLLDSGRDPKLLKNLYAGSGDINIAPLLPIVQFGDSAFSGPLIVAVDFQAGLLDYFFNDPDNGIVIISQENIEIVTEHCRSLMNQEVNDDSVFFRFYDPRIFMPLLEYLDDTAEASFFSHVIKKIIVQLDRDKFVSVSPYQEIQPDPERPGFILSQNALIALKAGHAQRILDMIGQHLEASIPAYEKLTSEAKSQFLKQAQLQAGLFGLYNFDDCKTFFSEWFLCKDVIQNSSEAMAVMHDTSLSTTQKLSYIFNFRIFHGNLSPFPIDPVAILARNDLYAFLKNRLDAQGNRQPVDLLDISDTVARMYYSKAYRTYAEDSASVYDIAARLFSREFASLNRPYNFYTKENAVLEGMFCTALKKELSHG